MILIYAEELSPRLKYITKLLFEDVLKTSFSLTADTQELITSEVPKINYSVNNFGGGLFLKPNPILFDHNIVAPKIEPVFYNGETCFFPTSGDSFLPFDPFASSFFAVTRMEEYLEPGGGKYGCYPPEKSFLARYGLLKKPVVNIWAQIVARKIQEYYPTVIFPKSHFNFISTIDIDNAWAFKHKGFIRNSGAFLKDLATGKWQNNAKRINTWLQLQPDPFDNYDYLSQVFEGNADKVVCFFLLGNYHKFDKNISHKNKHFRKLILALSEKYDVGIHPSFFSSIKSNLGSLSVEKNRLETITDKKVAKSRQHFLRLFFPKTYQNLINQGITEDFSMGYSAQTGFRAGICTPFNFFDLEKDLETNLKIYPFQVMDVTLHEYLGLKPEEVKIEIGQLMEEVKKIGGTFISVWHNETLDDSGTCKGFREVFEFMNKTGFRWVNE